MGERKSMKQQSVAIVSEMTEKLDPSRQSNPKFLICITIVLCKKV
jgi:hypothetical protein